MERVFLQRRLETLMLNTMTYEAMKEIHARVIAQMERLAEKEDTLGLTFEEQDRLESANEMHEENAKFFQNYDQAELHGASAITFVPKSCLQAVERKVSDRIVKGILQIENPRMQPDSGRQVKDD